MRRDRRLRDRRKRADASVRRQSRARDSEASYSTQHALGIYYHKVLTSHSFFLGESSPRDLGTSSIRISLDILPSNDTLLNDVTGLNQSNK